MNGLGAPYWWSGFFHPLVEKQPSDDLHPSVAEQTEILKVAQDLWPGWRSVHDYAGDAFVVEERHNGKNWMDSDEIAEASDEDDGEDEGLELAAARPL